MAYNGWANYETWNVALWIGNDEGLHSIAREVSDYSSFVERIEECGPGPIAYRTPDGVAWNDSGLDKGELDNMLSELGGE